MKKGRIKGKLVSSLIIALIAFGSIITFGFRDSYFEISKNLDILSVLFRELNIYYVDETNPGDLMKKGIDSMLESLDPYTTYIPESDIEDYRFMVSGEYGGIGALILKQNEYVFISEPYEGFAAHKAGVLAGDKILKINGIDVKSKNTSEISKILKGQAGTEVDLTIERHGIDEPIEKKLIREEIKIPNVPYAGMVDSVTGYIKLTSFTETASKEVKEAFKMLKTEKGMKKVILDLRNNGGGLLREAVEIVNFFVAKGEMVVSTKGKVKEWDREHKAIDQPLDTEMPLVVLINENSASASEIVSGAIQDLDRGVLVGRQSFGKGLVQQTRNLSYNSKLKLTIAKYYIPSGRCIQKIDYSSRNKFGKAGEVPDSLIKGFATKNGRKVHDGRGISPDVELERESRSKVLYALLSKYHVFNYCTEFYFSNSSIKEPENYRFTDADYAKFKTYLKDKEYEYSTDSEDVMNKLEEIAKEEKYFDKAAEEFNKLKEKISPNKEEDLERFKAEIIERIENDIVARYYYQKGRVLSSLRDDVFIDKSLEVLHDIEKYESILGKPH